MNLFLSVPTLALSLYHSRKGSVKARIVLLGVLAYFAYTFLSYGVLFKLNPGFIFYTAAFALSLYATLLNLAGFNIGDITIGAPDETGRRTQYALVIVVLIMFFLWIPDLATYYLWGQTPTAISAEGFHTLVLPFQDFSIIPPLTLLTIWLVRRDMAWGYVLAPVILVKVFSIAMAVIGMIIVMSIMEPRLA
ncbi:MAG: hypothetical protein ACLFVP_07155 [Candidatus Bathyarchaeia archaeon]